MRFLLRCLCMLLSVFLVSLARVPVVATDSENEIRFVDCLPTALTSGSEVTFLNGWAPVKGAWDAEGFFDTAYLNYYSSSKFTAKDSTGGSWRSNRGFELLSADSGVGVGAMYTVSDSGLVTLSLEALTGNRNLTSSMANQEKLVVNGITYYGYYSKADNAKHYYAKSGGTVTGTPTGGWFRYDTAASKMKAAGNVSDAMAMAYPVEAFAYDIAITHNGKIIWPSNGQPWHYEGSVVDYTARSASEDMLSALSAAEDLPCRLYVEQGDEIAFVATCGSSSNCYLVMEPVITYTSRLAPISVQAGMTVDDKFAVDYYLQADARAEQVGLLVDDVYYPATRQADGSYLLSIGDIAAKQLGDAITVTPMQTVDGYVLKASPITLSPADLLMQYVRADAKSPVAQLAIAILNYGTEAQRYFDYHTEKPMNEQLSEDQRSGVYTGRYESILAARDSGSLTVLPRGMALSLNDTVDFLMCVEAEEDGNYRVQMSRDEAFSSCATVEKTLVAGVEETVLLAGIMPATWNTPYYFRILDEGGNVVSPILTYSVTSYIVRIMEKETAEEEKRSTALLSSMLALYEAAEEYRAVYG